MKLKLIGFVLAGLMSSQMSFAALSPYAEQEVTSVVARIVESNKMCLRGEVSKQQRDLLIAMADNAVASVALAAAGIKGIELQDQWFMTEERGQRIMNETEHEVLARYSELKKEALRGSECAN